MPILLLVVGIRYDRKYLLDAQRGLLKSGVGRVRYCRLSHRLLLQSQHLGNRRICSDLGGYHGSFVVLFHFASFVHFTVPNVISTFFSLSVGSFHNSLKTLDLVFDVGRICKSFNSMVINLHNVFTIVLDSERSEECINFTMIITSRNNAPISNFGGGFRCKSEYPWCIIEEFLRKTSFRPNRFFFMVVIQKLIAEIT
ncbi:Uncharacterized protein FWK35_00015427 [Aphis craccivora]|uniref:Uncharacterized protein n=1 Tax=Aphis craccivora TaxID=307492 RepID=A0A6G0YZX0_APHCR|nr:Uncharacterized protein FWK35_00015427 [Aphis craccivora]